MFAKFYDCNSFYPGRLQKDITLEVGNMFVIIKIEPEVQRQKNNFLNFEFKMAQV